MSSAYWYHWRPNLPQTSSNSFIHVTAKITLCQRTMKTVEQIDMSASLHAGIKRYLGEWLIENQKNYTGD